MNLGPGVLHKSIVRSIVNRSEYKNAIKRYINGEIEWKDAQLNDLKRRVRLALRAHQEGRCVYCRRLIKVERRNACEDIEHYLDKSKPLYRKWAFCCVNLSLACHACNLEKGGRNLGASLVGPAGSTIDGCGGGLYVWLHPYFDNYHEHIDIGRGWTYKVKAGAPHPLKAKQMIDDLKLKEIERIESEAERVKYAISRLTRLAMKSYKAGRNDRGMKFLEKSQQLQEESTFG